MPAKPQIIKDGLVVNDTWILIKDAADAIAAEIEDQSIVPLSLWQAEQSLRRKNIGLLLDNDVDLTTISINLKVDLNEVPVIAVNFPIFTDGRGFSIARLLRERYGYRGEIRAVGYVLRDQLHYLKRSGFNAFSFDPANFLGTFDLVAISASLNDFTDAYQISADTPTPLFRRRA